MEGPFNSVQQTVIIMASCDHRPECAGQILKPMFAVGAATCSHEIAEALLDLTNTVCQAKILVGLVAYRSHGVLWQELFLAACPDKTIIAGYAAQLWPSRVVRL